jgi:DNA polymerase/3'-5' exonuclease PolX
MIDNQSIADHLKQISYIFLKDKEPWKAKAFSKVADEVESRCEPVPFEDGRLAVRIPGAGKAITEVMEQFVATGTSRKLEGLKARLPDAVFERFDAGVCKRKVTRLLAPLTEAGVDWGFAGSARRGCKTVKDVDVVVCIVDERERGLLSDLLEEEGLSADVRDGQEKIGVSVPVLSQGRSFTLDLNLTIPERRGAMYLYFTGPKAYNIGQRGIAKRMGMKLNQNGLFRDGECIASRTEEDIFEALGMEYVEPRKRL